MTNLLRKQQNLCPYKICACMIVTVKTLIICKILKIDQILNASMESFCKAELRVTIIMESSCSVCTHIVYISTS